MKIKLLKKLKKIILLNSEEYSNNKNILKKFSLVPTTSPVVSASLDMSAIRQTNVSERTSAASAGATRYGQPVIKAM
jgi:hypothetical protein